MNTILTLPNVTYLILFYYYSATSLIFFFYKTLIPQNSEAY